MTSRMMHGAILLSLGFLVSPLKVDAESIDESTRYVDFGAIAKGCGITQIGIYPDAHLLTLIGSIVLPPRSGSPEEQVTLSGILYRNGKGPWLRSAISDQVGTHSITRLPNGKWLLNDGAHNRMLQIDDLSGEGKIVSRYELGGVALMYPHDQIVDPTTGYIYVVDGNGRLYRFQDLEGPVEVWTFTPEQFGYARSLSWFDGHVHIIHTSRGEVIRIDDYTKHAFTVFKSPRPANRRLIWQWTPYGDAPSGTLETTGLVLDSVRKGDDGWYYASNDFNHTWALGGDPRPARLIRWRTWEDFEAGKWQDLSSYIQPSDMPLFPYFLTIYRDILYAGLIDREDRPKPGKNESPCGYNNILQLDLRSIGR
jgi:hypothetical protein